MDCPGQCSPGSQMVSLGCGPILESNAACGGGHCCVPVDAGAAGNDGGAGGAGGNGGDGGTATSFVCGSDTCVAGNFCSCAGSNGSVTVSCFGA